MDLPGGTGSHDVDGKHDPSAPSSCPPARTTFTPMAFDGLAWVQINRPQPSARSACLNVAAYIHLLQPGTPLRDLDAQVEPAIRALEEGAASITVIDGRHRVDRTGACPDRDARS